MSFGIMQGISIPMPCTGRVFPISYRNHLGYSSTPSPQSMMEWSIEREVFLGAELR
jgi:hypothetical protein